MEKKTRDAIESATQDIRGLLEKDFAAQLQGDYDVMQDGRVGEKPGDHLNGSQRALRTRIVAAIEHKCAQGMTPRDAVADFLRDTAFTTLNRFVALKMLEARDLVQECVSRGEASSGYVNEFCGLAPGMKLLNGEGYRIYIECIFDELSTEVKVLFDRRDPASALWPRKATFEEILATLNDDELKNVWGEDETIGWVYQFFNGQDVRKMREESPAPRNSRELAVRNQFFTPRYIVQFLADNTLGRIWYEMRGKETVITKLCEYMVRQTDDEMASRAKKDPRDLNALDPACGSGHFLLYLFGLLVAIYEEAFSDPDSPISEATGRKLTDDYASIDELRIAIPSLILEYNLHGVDIDPRCAQIAQLALWLRVQRAYGDFGISRAERPPIRRSNIVVAEPLVTNVIAEKFILGLEDDEIRRAFTALVSSLKLAGDLGLLLRIERVVTSVTKDGHAGLFALSEERIQAILESFMSSEFSSRSGQRRLFVDDTVNAVGLFAIATKKYDVILMNPPFGAFSTKTRDFAREQYSNEATDILAAFVTRSQELLYERGYMGAITSRTGFYNESLSDWRRAEFCGRRLRVFADLGENVLDGAMVEVAAYTMSNCESPKETLFIRAVAAKEKSNILRDATRRESEKHSFSVDTEDFMKVRMSPFAYWVAPRILHMAASGAPLEPDWADVRSGLQTNDDNRFVRLRWEVKQDDIRISSGHKRAWVGILKADEAVPWYSDINTLVKWHDDGRELKALVEHKGNSVSRHVPNEAYYFRPGVSWAKRTARCVPTLVPAGVIPTVSRYIAYPTAGREGTLLGLLASDAASALLRWNAENFARPIWGTRLLKNLWVPDLPDNIASAIAAFSKESVSNARKHLEQDETSSWFVGYWNDSCIERKSFSVGELGPLENKVFDCYGFTSTEATDILMDLREAMDYRGGASLSEQNDDEQSQGETSSSVVDHIHLQLSYALGVLMGRWDCRKADACKRAVEADVFAFQTIPPAQLRATRIDVAEYPLKVLPAGVAHDDDGADNDISFALYIILQHISAREAIGSGDNTLNIGIIRAYMSREFFAIHIKQYTACRRKAPVYWQLTTSSGRYSVWLYLHDISRDTLFQVQNDFVATKLTREEYRLQSIASEANDGGSAAQRKAFAAQEALVDELRSFSEEIKRVAPLWSPDLDDGVVINFAPLWRLVPQHKAWQKELRATWDALRDAKYEWAHLAMHLWPERVIPKCATDRSLAIAHGLEDIFWIQGADGKWKTREAPTKPVEALVSDRTSLAVKAALKSLMDAPDLSGPAKRGRKTKAS